MKKRPNPVWHMMMWGFSSGIILAWAYIVILMDSVGGGDHFGETFTLLFSPFSWWLAFVFGGLPGALMGSILSVPLWWILKDVPLPFTKDRMKQKRGPVYSFTFVLTLLMSASLISMFFGTESYTSYISGLFMAPPIIASIASTYVAHRYMYRLRLWSGGMESRKSKAKNEAIASRLVDTTNDSGDYSHESDESQSQGSQAKF